MNAIDKKIKLRIIFQAFIIGFVLFYLNYLQLPSKFSNKSTKLLIMLILACMGLLYIMVRVCFKNVKKWEMVLYYVLNVLFVFTIVYCMVKLGEIAVDVARDTIPYEPNTPEYDNAYEDSEAIGLTNGFTFVLFGIPTCITTFIFMIIGIVLTCVQKEETIQTIKFQRTEPLEDKSINGTPNYCMNCGKKIDYRYAKFCTYCGKEIKYRK